MPALLPWFFAIGQMPLPTAVTLNHRPSVWMALLVAAGLGSTSVWRRGNRRQA